MVFRTPRLRGIWYLLGVHINLPFDKEKELLGLIKKFVRSKNSVRYFALMVIPQQKWGFGHDEDQGDYKSHMKYKSKALSPGEAIRTFSTFAVTT